MSNLNALDPQNPSPLIMTDEQKLRELMRLITDGLSGEHSRRAYTKALRGFLAWHSAQGRPQLSQALVQHYRLKLERDGLFSSIINQRMSAIRKLAVEAADNGLLDPVLAHGNKGVKGVRTERRRSANRLTKEQALLAVLAGCAWTTNLVPLQ
jgi:site-specific recombinase XerC